MKKNQENLLRTFLAFDIDAPLRKNLAEIIETLKNQSRADKVKWVPPENLHVTLRFLGAVAAEKVVELAKIISEEIKEVESFGLELGKIIHFPPLGKPHVIALSFPLTTELAKLFQAIERSVTRCGFTPEDQPFLPHLTLGRLHFSHELDLSQISIPLSKKLLVKEIILYRSDPGKTGSVYTAVKTFKLRNVKSSG